MIEMLTDVVYMTVKVTVVMILTVVKTLTGILVTTTIGEILLFLR
jgi:hypothetical protein